ncbi:glycosyltransferase family 9 protein [Brenneria populi subsp. brevivirga]|uniref:glycosyltransferase family 9 protein n=1 Tax=Brenneria populi TaxID=1505588 RepID=UPI002E178CFC|nr:glycosyltransferase family 9 protein [Brenneria populi subsp. brevivirga]
MFDKLRQLNRARNLKTKKLKLRIKNKLLAVQIKNRKEKIALSEIKNICILLFNIGIGDNIIATGFIRELSKHGYNISVFINSKTAFLFENNPYVQHIYFVEGKFSLIDKKIPHFDLLIDPYSRMDDHFRYAYLKVMRKLTYKYAIGFNVKDLEIYNENIVFTDKAIHLTDVYQKILESIHINDANLSYEFNIPENHLAQAKDYLSHYHDKTIISFNPFASCNVRSFTLPQINELLNKLSAIDDVIVIIIGEEHKTAELAASDKIIHNPFKSFFGASAIMSLSDIIISVETAMVHVSNALDKELVSIYSSEILDGFESNFLFAPHYDKAVQLIAPDKNAANMDMTLVYNEVMEKIHSHQAQKP